MLVVQKRHYIQKKILKSLKDCWWNREALITQAGLGTGAHIGTQRNAHVSDFRQLS